MTIYIIERKNELGEWQPVNAPEWDKVWSGHQEPEMLIRQRGMFGKFRVAEYERVTS